MDGEKGVWLEMLDGSWSGLLRLRVHGRSMWPTLRPGDQVTVEPVTVEGLRAGDWVLLRGPDQLFLHRFLGFTSGGQLLTKGDGHRAPDSPWPPGALLGRTIAFTREGRSAPVSSSSLRERALTRIHRLMAVAWSLVRRGGLLVLLLASIPMIVRASVGLVSFEAIPLYEDGAIRVAWETASETDMSYFLVERAIRGAGPYQAITSPIVAAGDMGWADYEIIDTQVQVGPTYYYRLVAVETGGAAEFYGPISASLAPATPTPTPTRTPAPTQTLTPAQTPTPTQTPPAETPISTPSPPVAPSPDLPATSTPRPSEAPFSPATSPTATPAPPTSTPPVAPPSPDAGPGLSPEATSISPPQGSAAASTPTPSPAAAGQSSPSPSDPSQASVPDSSRSSPGATREVEVSEGVPRLWGCLLPGLIGAGIGLILLGMWGSRRARDANR